MIDVRRNLNEIMGNIETSAAVFGRNVEDIELIAVTKYVDVSRIQAAVDAGISNIGENRVQEFLSKLDFYDSLNLRKHFIGQLQTNKVKYVTGKVALIQSVDRLPLASAISRRAAELNIVQGVLIEVNIGNEPQKGGISADELTCLLETVSAMPGIAIKGLMCIPPVMGEPEARKYFSAMHRLFIKLSQDRIEGVEMRYLSMGMSGDYRVAIEEGANMVRIGTALFGGRI